MKTAARVTHAYMAIIGTVLSVAMLATMQWWLDALAGGFGLLGWFLLYRIVYGMEQRNAKTKES